MLKQDFYYRRVTLFILCLTVFIDGMGIGSTIPILNSLLRDASIPFFHTAISASKRSLLYGLTNGLGILSCLVGFLILGALSDYLGRKKIIVLCLIGTGIGYLLFAQGIVAKQFSWILIGRVIDGFTAGSQTIARSAAIDLSRPENKRRYLAWLLLFTSLGIVLGPAITGILINPTIVPWFNFTTPMYFAMFLSFANSLLAIIFLKETRHIVQKLSAKACIKALSERIMQTLKRPLQYAPIRQLSIAYMLFEFVWAIFIGFMPVFMQQHFAYSAYDNSFYIAWASVGLCIGFLPKITTLYGKASIHGRMRINQIFIAAVFLLLLSLPYQWLAWLFALPLCLGIAVTYNDFLLRFSNQVDENQQGSIMGFADALMAFAMGTSYFINGALIGFNPDLPLMLAVAALLASVALMRRQTARQG